jgi:hypoxanthine phosphoribosyltransferase
MEDINHQEVRWRGVLKRMSGISEMGKYELRPLLDQDQIRRRVKELAEQISRDYRGKEILFICILKGAFVFLSDLMRHIDLPVQVDFVGLASYGSEMVSSGQIRVTQESSIPIEGKDVIVIEDIIDSGRTLKFLADEFRSRKPRSLRICCLLDKKSRRQVEFDPDYVGFDIEDRFVVGYGLDVNEQFRNLPSVHYVVE